MLSGHSRIELGGDALVRFFVCVPVGALRHQKLDEARRERLLYSIFFRFDVVFVFRWDWGSVRLVCVFFSASFSYPLTFLSATALI